MTAYYECQENDKYDYHMMLTMQQACPIEFPSFAASMSSIAEQVFNPDVRKIMNVREIRYKSLRNVKFRNKRTPSIFLASSLRRCFLSQRRLLRYVLNEGNQAIREK